MMLLPRWHAFNITSVYLQRQYPTDRTREERAEKRGQAYGPTAFIGRECPHHVISNNRTGPPPRRETDES